MFLNINHASRVHEEVNKTTNIWHPNICSTGIYQKYWVNLTQIATKPLLRWPKYMSVTTCAWLWLLLLGVLGYLMRVTVFLAVILVYLFPRYSVNTVFPYVTGLVDSWTPLFSKSWYRWAFCVYRMLTNSTPFRYLHGWNRNQELHVVSWKQSDIPITAPKKKKAQVILYSRAQPSLLH